MRLLAAKLYDPATAVSKSTATLIAMTAFDTTNLRLAITVPAHGMVLFRMLTTLTGATTVPTVFLGVMNGATVLARVTPQDFPGTMNAATQSCPVQCEFIVTGLTPGAMNVDAAYGVEVIVTATAIKYGGPNNATTNDAWGAFCFEAWDPQPADQPTDVWAAATRTLTAGTNIVLAKGTGITGFNDIAAVDVWAAATRTLTSGVNIALAKGTGLTGLNDIAATDVWAAATRTLTAGTNIALAKGTGLTGLNDITAADVWASVTRTLTSGVNIALAKGIGLTGLNDLDAAAVRAAIGLALANLDTQLAPIAGIKAKTDNLTFNGTNELKVDILRVNGLLLQGTGTAVDKWRAS